MSHPNPNSKPAPDAQDFTLIHEWMDEIVTQEEWNKLFTRLLASAKNAPDSMARIQAARTLIELRYGLPFPEEPDSADQDKEA